MKIKSIVRAILLILIFILVFNFVKFFYRNIFYVGENIILPKLEETK